jgi:hypothetical protein
MQNNPCAQSPRKEGLFLPRLKDGGILGRVGEERTCKMNQPTEDRFRQVEERQVEFEKRLMRIERQTEPMQITRLEIDAGGIHRRLDEVQDDTGILKAQMEGVRADVSIVKSNQGDLKEYLEGQFKSIDQKQDAHQDLIGQLIGIGEEHTKSFTEIKATMATKEDLKAIRDDMAEMKAILLQIAKQQKPSE